MISLKKNSEFSGAENTDSVQAVQKVVRKQSYIGFPLLMMDLRKAHL